MITIFSLVNYAFFHILCKMLFLICISACCPSIFTYNISTRGILTKAPTEKPSSNRHCGSHAGLNDSLEKKSCAFDQNDLVESINIINECLKNIHATCEQGHTLLHEAVLKNDLRCVASVCQLTVLWLKPSKAKDFINKKDNAGFTALHYAVDPITLGSNNQAYPKTQLKILELLLQHPYTRIIETDKDGKTVLHWAVTSNNLKAVETILEHVQSNLASCKDFINMKTFVHPQTHQGGCPAIYWTTILESLEEDGFVARETSLNIFKLLFKSFRIDDTDNQGHTLAHWVVVQGRNDMFKLMVQHQFDLTIKDEKGRTPLHATIETIGYAYKSGNKSLLKYLSEEKDSILNQLLKLPASRIGCDKQDNNGAIPVVLASKLKLPEHIVERLQNKTQEQKTTKRRNCYKLRCTDCSLPIKKIC